MAHTLLLIRHSKAVHDGTVDIERSLSPRGVRDAAAAGHWLAGQRLIPDRVVVSPSRRTVETWDAMTSTLGATPEIGTDARIYENTTESLLDVVRDVPDNVSTVALVGHNPSMHGFAHALDDGEGDEAARSAIDVSFPTSGIAVLDCPSDWSQLTLGGATVREFVTPRGATDDRS